MRAIPPAAACLRGKTSAASRCGKRGRKSSLHPSGAFRTVCRAQLAGMRMFSGFAFGGGRRRARLLAAHMMGRSYAGICKTWLAGMNARLRDSQIPWRHMRIFPGNFPALVCGIFTWCFYLCRFRGFLCVAADSFYFRPYARRGNFIRLNIEMKIRMPTGWGFPFARG